MAAQVCCVYFGLTVKGAEIIQALISSSATYESKTEYSKEKWLKKKQEKYYTIVEVTKPTAYTLCNCYFKKHHKKIKCAYSKVPTYFFLAVLDQTV